MERTVLHCDLNSFYASVELLSRPELRRFPVAVGGDEKSRHGIILAKNDNAKKYGVQTGESLFTARKKCPELVVISPDFEKYMYYSKKVRSIYCRFTDQVESFGADECWCDVTGSSLLFGSGEEIADKMRRAVAEETGLTISVGVSFNKTMAKLGSDLKKPDAVTVIRPRDLPTRIWKLDCSMLFGVGRATAAKLKSYGIYTIGDVAMMDEAFASNVFGKNGITVRNFARGVDDSPVMHCEYVPDVKSISHGCTSAFDIYDLPTARKLIMSLSEAIGTKLRKNGFIGRCIQVHITDSRLSVRSFSHRTAMPVRGSFQISDEAYRLMAASYDFSNPIRAISVGVSALEPDDAPFQLDLYTDYSRLDKKIKLEQTADAIREKMGKGAIIRASLMNVDFTRNCAIYDFNPFGKNAMK